MLIPEILPEVIMQGARQAGRVAARATEELIPETIRQEMAAATRGKVLHGGHELTLAPEVRLLNLIV